MCNDNRIVTHTGLYYSTSKSTYSYRMFGLQNGQKYTVQITSVNTGGGTNTYTHPRQVQPTIAFPKLNNSATSSPAMFLDSLSVAYGALLQWRDSSGNGRHMVQPLTTMAPISYGWGYTTSYTTSYPAGGVYFSYGGYYVSSTTLISPSVAAAVLMRCVSSPARPSAACLTSAPAFL